MGNLESGKREKRLHSPIQGLHHVTATVNDAQEDLDFFAVALGLRLVKKTVNFDNHLVYHFYYGDGRGTPGSLMTTFPYRGMGVPVGTRGAGQISATAFSVPSGSLDFWRRHLGGHGVAVAETGTRFGQEFIAVEDPSGLVIELVAEERDERVPWTTESIGPDAAIRGLHGITMLIRSLDRSLELLTGILGYASVEGSKTRVRLAVGGDAPGRRIDLVSAPEARPAVNGLGTVHHVAMAVPDAEGQLNIRTELLELGYKVTQVLDRQYFRSIYFREPGGVLFEIATIPPGFTVDEAPASLGRDLKLPPWEEPNRDVIEAGLPSVRLMAR